MRAAIPNIKAMNIPIPATNLFAHLYHIFIYLAEAFSETVMNGKITWIKWLISKGWLYLLTSKY